MSSSVVQRYLALSRLRGDDVAWRLLRADHAEIIAATLGAHLGGTERRLPAAELYEKVDADLEQLRDLGAALPNTASWYCAQWRDAGFLTRRASGDSRVETLELSAGGLDAIRVLESLDQPVATATESRLGSIRMQLQRLAVDTDPDKTSRLQALHVQRAAIDAEIERVENGQISTLDDERARERAWEILAQIGEMPGDFARVRDEFDRLGRTLREQVLDSEERGREVLGDIFRGVDLIADSAAGRSFTAFSALVHDEELGASVDHLVDQILNRSFASELPTAQRRALRRFVVDLKARSFEIHEVMTRFARGLRQYVQSQEYQSDRALRALLTESMRLGVRAAEHTRPWHPTGLTLDLTAARLSPIGAVTLHDPSEHRVAAALVVHDPPPVDIEQLRLIARETEIDVDELTRNVNAVLETRDSATLSDVLDAYPATQGIASIVGLIGLAFDQGVAGEGDEQVSWVGADHRERSARIPALVFTGRVI